MMKQTAAAIDFGTSKIVTLIGEGGSGVPCDILGSGIVPYDGFMGGRWNNPDQLEAAIRRSIQDAENASHRKITDLFVGIPGEFIRVVLNEVSVDLKNVHRRISADDVDQLMASAMACSVPTGGEVIHRSPAWFAVDERRTMEPIGLKGTMLRCMAAFIAADTQFMSDIGERLQDLQLEVRGFLSSSLGEALMLLPPEERDKTAVLLDVGYLTTEVMVVEGDAFIYHEVLPIGGGHITADLAYGLELTMDIAEQVKRKLVFGPGYMQGTLDIVNDSGETINFPRAQIMDIVIPRVDEMADMVQEVLSDPSVNLPARASIYMTGGGLAPVRGMREYLSTAVNRSIKAPLPRATKLNSPMYTSSLGLMDLCFESIAQAQEDSASPIARAVSFLRDFFTRTQ